MSQDDDFIPPSLLPEAWRLPKDDDALAADLDRVLGAAGFDDQPAQ
jgi:hypothetical protein